MEVRDDPAAHGLVLADHPLTRRRRSPGPGAQLGARRAAMSQARARSARSVPSLPSMTRRAAARLVDSGRSAAWIAARAESAASRVAGSTSWRG